MIVSYIIHLSTSTARAPFVAALAARLPQSRTVAAVDGRALSPAARSAACVPHLHRPTYPFAPLPGEIGCFLSHRACWQALVDSDAEAAFIAEDDVRPAPGFDAARHIAEAHIAPDRYIRFALKGREWPAPVAGRR